MLELKNIGLVELNAQEINETEGGILLEALLGFLIGTIAAIGDSRGWW
jgi:hypothetical protein